MSETKHMNRWWVVIGALIIQISLGAVYIWSVFQTPLKTFFPTWSETAVTLPAQIVLAMFALAVIIGGRIQDRIGPRKVATAGGIILGTGLILARFTEYFEPSWSLLWLILTFSVLGGIGIGTGYVCPIATCVKWFPDKRGLVTGLAVAGFGAGAFFFAPLAKALITGGAYQLFNQPLFSLPKIGVFNTFLTLGIIFLTAVVTGAQLLRNPPAGYKPAGWNPPQPAQSAAPKADYTPSEMLRMPAFWLLWITYFAGCTAGLQIIMKASPIWQSFRTAVMTAPIQEEAFNQIAAAGATAVAVLAIFNSLGRILWGKISDAFGRKGTLITMFILCGAAMLLLDRLREYPIYLVGVSLIGLCFGGYLALYPAVTADFFGTKHFGVNYGFMFTAFGAGGIVGPYLAAALMKTVNTISYLSRDSSGAVVEKLFTIGNYRLAFWVAGIACLVAAAVMTQIKPPKKS
ncbi:MAG: OFA family MFS transporter [Anaerohalosphaeraceae bacterium]